MMCMSMYLNKTHKYEYIWVDVSLWGQRYQRNLFRKYNWHRPGDKAQVLKNTVFGNNSHTE